MQEMYLIIVNGKGGSGKDTFEDLFSKVATSNGYSCGKYSTIDPIKDLAKQIGWNFSKTDKDRKFLFDLKLLTTEYNDYPFEQMKIKIQNACYEYNFYFVDCREPKEIKRIVHYYYDSKSDISDTIIVPVTLLVRRPSTNRTFGNEADDNVENYNYDYIIENNGTIGELKEKAIKLFDELCKCKK